MAKIDIIAIRRGLLLISPPDAMAIGRKNLQAFRIINSFELLGRDGEIQLVHTKSVSRRNELCPNWLRCRPKRLAFTHSNLAYLRARFGRKGVRLATYLFHTRLRSHAAVGREPLLSMAYSSERNASISLAVSIGRVTMNI